jgi:hypothetical protein
MAREVSIVLERNQKIGKTLLNWQGSKKMGYIFGAQKLVLNVHVPVP